MAGTLDEIAERYMNCFQDYLRGGGEAALRQAYELGRVALIDGLGVLEITVLHHQALAHALGRSVSPADGARIVRLGESFFLESLAPFEMTHRGFRETNVLLQDSDERYRELFENASDIVFITDTSGDVISMNPAGEHATGYMNGETPPVNISQIVAAEYRRRAEEMIDNCLAGSPAEIYELDLVSRDGRTVPVEVSSRVILREGQPAGVQGIARDITERRLARRALRRLNEAMEEEARRIAHAIHDEAGQLLATVHIALEEAIGVAAAEPEKLRGKIDKTKDLLFQIEEQLRGLSHELRPTLLDDLGVRAAIEFLTEGVSRRTGLDIKLDILVEERLAAPVEIALYRITQEALNNISKHAQAKNVWIQVGVNEHIKCCVKDDGVGFDVRAIFQEKGRVGLGLRGVQERLAALGGKMSILSEPGKGTELQVTIPVAAAAGALE